VQERSESE